jgi:outer membrane protein assembly factor BamB
MMRTWITSVAIGLLIAQAFLVALPGDARATQQAEVRTFGSVEAKGSLFVTSSLGLHAIDLTAGTERWRVSTSTAASSYPAFAAGIVYFITEASPSTDQAAVAHAVEASSGRELWTFELDGILPTDDRGLTGPVIVSDQKAYLFDSARFFVLDAQTGPVNGQPMATGFQPIGATVLAAHGTTLLLANMSHSGIGCVELSTGEERWTAPIPTDSFPVRSASDATTLYLTDTHNSLVALDWATGEQLWNAPLGAAPRFVHVADSGWCSGSARTSKASIRGTGRCAGRSPVPAGLSMTRSFAMPPRSWRPTKARSRPSMWKPGHKPGAYRRRPG